MAWPKPINVDPTYAPEKIHRWRWMLFFIVLLLVCSFVTILFWPNKDYATQPLFWIGVTAISLVVTGILFSIRMYYFGLEQEKYDVWQDEQQIIEKNWQNWAMQSLVILDSFYLLPNQLTTQKIVEEEKKLAMQFNKSLFFDQHEYNHFFEALFVKFKKTLQTLTEVKNIEITVYSSPESYANIDDVVAQAYQAVAIKTPYSLSHLQEVKADVEQLEKLIDQSESNPQLIIINNIKSNESAFFCGFLLLNRDEYQNLEIQEAGSQILRPMVTNNLSDDLELLVKRQTILHDIDQRWSANVTEDEDIKLANQLVQLNITPKSSHKLERFVGNQMDLSYWLSLAIISEMTTNTKQNNLITAMSEDQWLFSVITAVV